jgi:hypothetical protein
MRATGEHAVGLLADAADRVPFLPTAVKAVTSHFAARKAARKAEQAAEDHALAQVTSKFPQGDPAAGLKPAMRGMKARARTSERAAPKAASKPKELTPSKPVAKPKPSTKTIGPKRVTQKAGAKATKRITDRAKAIRKKAATTRGDIDKEF